MSAANPDTPPVPPAAAALVTTVARGLRAAGAVVSTGEMLDAVRALAAVDLSARPDVVDALRTTLLKTSGWDQVLDGLCDALLPRYHPGPAGAGHTHGPTADGPADSGSAPDDLLRALLGGESAEVDRVLHTSLDRFAGLEPGNIRSEGHHTQRVLRRLDLARLYQDLLRQADARDALARQAAAAEAAEQVAAVRRRVEELLATRMRELEPGAADPLGAPLTALEDVPLLHAGPEYLVALRAAVQPLARKLATRLGRRRRRGRGALDVRRTVRNSLSSGGVPLHPAMRRRRHTRPDLVVLCDVSGSTAQFAPFTLALLHALHEEFGRVRSFVFVDGIVEITELLENAPGVVDPRHLLAHRGLIAADGRSDYRRALRTFVTRWPDTVTSRSTVLIAGDARSHDRPPALEEVRIVAHQARRLYWLNPEPATEWDSTDSRFSHYAPYCSGVYEVATLRQLGECVAAIAG
jgi:uncharacterized protein with von Willebrand factor type A (vWA) domain